MSKKQKKAAPVAVAVEIADQQPANADVVMALGYDEMLSELEAIVADAEIRLAEEEAA